MSENSLDESYSVWSDLQTPVNIAGAAGRRRPILRSHPALDSKGRQNRQRN